MVYLQKESVELAVRLFDQTELRLGSGEGLIGVQEAKWEEKKKESRDGKGGEELGGVEKKKKEERQKKMGKKAAALRQYVVSLSLSHYPRLFKRADLDEVDFVQEIRRLVFRRRGRIETHFKEIQGSRRTRRHVLIEGTRRRCDVATGFERGREG